MISRRDLLISSLLVAATPSGLLAADDDIQRQLADLERRHGGRLGVAILDTAHKRPIAYHGDEPFPMCSTFKLLAAACALARIDRGQERLDRRIRYAKADLIPYSPVTGPHAGGDGLSIAEICEAAITLSDNTAANLLLDSFGGPAGLTAWLRTLGDPVTRLDRREPDLNEAAPGDPRDTTTPLAMLTTMRELVLGTALSPSSRAQLTVWLIATKTGDKRLRAGLPQGWRVGDKTGTGNRNATNDVAIIWPTGRAPIIVTVYYVGADASEDDRSRVLADIGRIAATV